MEKSKVIVLNIAINWAVTKLDIWQEHMLLSFLHDVFMTSYIEFQI